MKGPKDLNGQLAAYSATSKSFAIRMSWRDRLGTWPTYCAAGAAALASATSASAGIIYSGPVNLTINLPPASFPTCGCGVSTAGHVAGLPNVSFNLGLFHGTSAGAHSGAAKLYFPYLSTPPHFQGGVFTNGFSSARKFNSGSLISTGRPSPLGGLAGNFSGATHGAWGGATATGFAGVLLFARSTTVGSSHYPLYNLGWMRLRVQDLDGDQIPDVLTLVDYAYNNTPFAPIYAGQTADTPEPSEASMMLLAAGAAGVLAWKRRKQAA